MTYEDAIKFCNEHTKNNIAWDDIWYEETEILNPIENIEV